MCLFSPFSSGSAAASGLREGDLRFYVADLREHVLYGQVSSESQLDLRGDTKYKLDQKNAERHGRRQVCE